MRKEQKLVLEPEGDIYVELHFYVKRDEAPLARSADAIMDHARDLLASDPGLAAALSFAARVVLRVQGEISIDNPAPVASPRRKPAKPHGSASSPKVKHKFEADGFCHVDHDGHGECLVSRKRKPRKGSAAAAASAEDRTAPLFADKGK